MPTSVAQRQIDLIDEQWKANNIDAMSCWDFEDFLCLCTEAFSRIGRQEDGWRRCIYDEQVVYSQDAEKVFLGLYRDWLCVCKNLVLPLKHFENKGFIVCYANLFRSCIREAEGILTPDDKFFASDALVSLRDDAIDECQRGGGERVGW